MSKRSGVIQTSKGDVPFFCSTNFAEYRALVASLPADERASVIDRLATQWRASIEDDFTGS